MGSSRYYKFWLRISSSWVEITRFTGLRFSDKVNYIPEMSATLYLTDSTQQDAIKAGTLYRVTKLDSTTGDNGTIIQTGILQAPSAQEKTAVRNDRAVIYQVSGSGVLEKIMSTTYDAETTFTSQTVSSIVTSLVANVNSRTANTIINGTYSTGSTITVRFRKAQMSGPLINLASISDATNMFVYYIFADVDGSYRPRLNVLAPDNATFVHPNGQTGYKITDPISASDPLRIIEEKTEAIDIVKSDENKRILNSVRVRFQGHGTGTGAGQTENALATDPTSITTFGRRESIAYAPWIQNSATADLYRNTLLDMFRGSAPNGIVYATAVLKRGEMYSTDFNAVLGDVIAIRRTSGTVITGKFLAYGYDQNNETLTIHIGLPKVSFEEAQGEIGAGVDTSYSAIEKTTSSLSAQVFNNVEPTPFTIDISSLSVPVSGVGNPATRSVVASGSTLTSGFHIYASFISQSFCDHLRISFVADTTLGAVVFQDHTITAIKSGTYSFRVFTPFSLTTTSETITQFRVVFTNNDGMNTFITQSSSSSNFVLIYPVTSSVDLSHTHTL